METSTGITTVGFTNMSTIFDDDAVHLNETSTPTGRVPVIPMKPSIPVDLGVGVGTLDGLQLHIAIGIEGILEIFIVFGNVLVIASIIGYRPMRRTKTTRYMLSLALSDLFVGLVIPIGLLSKYFPDFFFTSVQICVTPFCLMITLCCASIFNLMALSFDRYVAITEPLKYPLIMTTAKSNAIIACAWFGAILIGTAPLYWYQEPYYWQDTGELFSCTWDTIITDLYIVSFAVIGLLLPTVVILILYSRIFKIAVSHSRQRDQRQRMFDDVAGRKRSSTVGLIEINNENNSSRKVSRTDRKLSTQSNLTYANEAYIESPKQNGDNSESPQTNSKYGRNSCISESYPDVSEAENPRRFRAPSKSISAVSLKFSKLLRRNSSTMSLERRTSVTICLVVLAFIVCWVPFIIIMLLECLCRSPHTCGVTPSLRVWLGMLGYANSGVNPVIYTFRTEEFRKAIKHLLARIGCCKEEAKKASPSPIRLRKRKISSIKECSVTPPKSISTSEISTSRHSVTEKNVINESTEQVYSFKIPNSDTIGHNSDKQTVPNRQSNSSALHVLTSKKPPSSKESVKCENFSLEDSLFSDLTSKPLPIFNVS